MVINKTRAVAVISQAVWPESTTEAWLAHSGLAALIKISPIRASNLRFRGRKHMENRMKQKSFLE
jgi:hypothetical protein